MSAREVINGCAYEGRPASFSTWVCFSWPQAPQPSRFHVCVFGLIHFFAAAELPSSRPPKPNFHISSFICGSSQRVNPLFKGQLWVFFSWFQPCTRLFIVFVHCVHFQLTEGGYVLIHGASSIFNLSVVELYEASDSAADNMSCCLCACRAPS